MIHCDDEKDGTNMIDLVMQWMTANPQSGWLLILSTVGIVVVSVIIKVAELFSSKRRNREMEARFGTIHEELASSKRLYDARKESDESTLASVKQLRDNQNKVVSLVNHTHRKLKEHTASTSSAFEAVSATALKAKELADSTKKDMDVIQSSLVEFGLRIDETNTTANSASQRANEAKDLCVAMSDTIQILGNRLTKQEDKLVSQEQALDVERAARQDLVEGLIADHTCLDRTVADLAAKQYAMQVSLEDFNKTQRESVNHLANICVDTAFVNDAVQHAEQKLDQRITKELGKLSEIFAAEQKQLRTEFAEKQQKIQAELEALTKAQAEVKAAQKFAMPTVSDLEKAFTVKGDLDFAQFLPFDFKFPPITPPLKPVELPLPVATAKPEPKPQPKTVQAAPAPAPVPTVQPAEKSYTYAIQAAKKSTPESRKAYVINTAFRVSDFVFFKVKLPESGRVLDVMVCDADPGYAYTVHPSNLIITQLHLDLISQICKSLCKDEVYGPIPTGAAAMAELEKLPKPLRMFVNT